MIPKKIHYCWFGGNPLSELAKKCIDSWQKYCPDYEIIEWNEKNFDIESYRYAKEAYDVKKWAFVSDVARLYALVTCGGIYMDTDVELLKPLDHLLEYEALSGFEAKDRISTGLMACREKFPLFAELLADYDNRRFVDDEGNYDLTTNVKTITDICLKHGLLLNNQKQTVEGFTLFPADYFCPKDYTTGKLNITENTYAIHHFDGSWLSEEESYFFATSAKLAKVFPDRLSCYFAKFISVCKYHGIMAALKELQRFVKKKSK